MDEREMLAQLMLASMRGGNPMGGPQMYSNDLPPMPQQPNQVPPGWMPPGADFNRQQPITGPFYQPPPTPSYGNAPLFHRLNPAPRDNWRDMET